MAMKTNQILASLCLIVVLLGCNSNNLAPSPYSNINDQETELKEFPPTAAEWSVSLGETLLQTYLKTTGSAFRIEPGTVTLPPNTGQEPCYFDNPSFSFSGEVESFLARDYHSEKSDQNEALVCSEPIGKGVAKSLMICQSKEDGFFYLVRPVITNTSCMYGDYRLPRLAKLPTNAVSKISKEVFSETSYKYELIYNGRVGDGLRFIYREFYEDMARPSFTQEVQYDLSQSEIIGFKRAKVQIIEASNTEIKYKVISHL